MTADGLWPGFGLPVGQCGQRPEAILPAARHRAGNVAISRPDSDARPAVLPVTKHGLVTHTVGHLRPRFPQLDHPPSRPQGRADRVLASRARGSLHKSRRIRYPMISLAMTARTVSPADRSAAIQGRRRFLYAQRGGRGSWRLWPDRSSAAAAASQAPLVTPRCASRSSTAIASRLRAGNDHGCVVR
jgi:hypothetical protein